MKIKIISIVLFAVFLISSISGIVKATDVDEDGLDDDWEMSNFGNLNQGQYDDPDGDGYDNLQEYENDTDPNDANSPNNDNNDSYNGNPFGDMGSQFESLMIYALIFIIIFIASMITIAIASVGIFIRLGKIKKELNELPPEQKSQEKSNKTE